MEIENDKIEYLLNFDSGDFAKEVSNILKNDQFNTLKKCENVEIFTKMCKMSRHGYDKVLKIMEEIKSVSKKKYRFEWLVKELSTLSSPPSSSSLSTSSSSSSSPSGDIIPSDNNNDYKRDVLHLINTIITCTESNIDKKLIINEFLGLRIGEALKQLRSNKNSISACLINEILKFEENLGSEEDSISDLDVNQHTNIFFAILQKIKGTPTEARFLFCLQNLLQIDGSQTWDCAAKFLGKISTLEDDKKLEPLLRNEIKLAEKRTQPGFEHGDCKQNGCTCSCHSSNALGDSRSQSFNMKVKKKEIEDESPKPTSPVHITPIAAPPVPPPLPMYFPPAPPPPPPPMFPPPPPLSFSVNQSDSKSPGEGRKLPQIPPMGKLPPFDLHIPPPPNSRLLTFPQTESKIGALLPTPKKKMRRLQWNKIPAGAVLGKKNIWTAGGMGGLSGFASVGGMDIFRAPVNHKTPPSELSLTKSINFETIENMFALKESHVTVPSAGSLDEKDGRPEFKRRKLEEVSLLDSKRSLNINIFLHQIRFLHKDLITKILSGETSSLSIEKLKGLLRILPDVEELELIKSYKGDASKLGNAEKFYLELSQFPNFSNYVEVLLTKEEFGQITDTVKPALESYILTAQDIKDSKLLQEIFHIVLITGNFLNSGGFAGDAVAFKLSSLLNLIELKSNEPGLTFMHFIAQTASEKNSKLLKLPEELKWLKDTSQYSYDSITADVSSLRKRVETVRKHSEFVGEDMNRKLDTFLKLAEKELEDIEDKEKELEKLRIQLSEYFCEDRKSFNLDETVKIICTFVERFEKAVMENAKRFQRSKSKDVHVKFRRQSSLTRDPDKSSRFQKCMSENLQDKLNRQESHPALKHQQSIDETSTSKTMETVDAVPATPTSKEAEKKVRLIKDTTGDEELMELLNFGSTSSIDMINRTRRKPKTPVSSTFVDEERERATPDFELKSSFARNKFSRRTMIDIKSADRKRYSEMYETLPDFDCLENSHSRSTTKLFEFENMENNQLESKTLTYYEKLNSFQPSNQTLTEQALLKHIQSKRKNVNDDEQLVKFDSTRQKIAEYRQREAEESKQLQPRSSEITTNHQENKIHFKREVSSIPINECTLRDEIKYRKNAESHPGDGINCPSVEIESVSSGTDEGFESMRNSVADESRVSPLNQQQPTDYSDGSVQKSEKVREESKNCEDDNNKARTFTRSCGNLMEDAPLKISKIDEEPLQGATSMVMIHKDILSNNDDDITIMTMKSDYMDLRNLPAQKESSTSTLKSSNSGLHIKTLSNYQDSQEHLDNFVERSRMSSTSENSNSPETTKKIHKGLVDINKLTARLYQPKRLLSMPSAKKSSPQAEQTPSRQHSISSVDAFIRGSAGRSTLPPNVLNFNKKKASSHQANVGQKSVIPECPSFSMTNLGIITLPKPPTRTTSISTSDNLNANSISKRLSIDSRSRGISSFLNTTLSTIHSIASENKHKESTKTSDKTISSSVVSKPPPEKPVKQSLMKKIMTKTMAKSQTSSTLAVNEESSSTKMTRPSKPGTMTRYKR